MFEHKQVVVVSKVKSSNAWVVVIVDELVSRNNNPKNARLVVFILSPFSKIAVNNTLCDIIFDMYKLTYFLSCIIICL